MHGNEWREAGHRGARRGAQVLERFREQPAAIWYRGEPVRDVTAHAAFRGGAHSLAPESRLLTPESSPCASPTPITIAASSTSP